MFKTETYSKRARGFITGDIVPDSIIKEESVKKNITLTIFSQEYKEQTFSDLVKEDMENILRQTQEKLEDTIQALKSLQITHENLKIEHENLSKKLEEYLLENFKSVNFIKALKTENQNSIVCILKMLRIFQKQNTGTIDEEFEGIVKKIFLI